MSVEACRSPREVERRPAKPLGRFNTIRFEKSNRLNTDRSDADLDEMRLAKS
jgi:hypothetical protein